MTSSFFSRSSTTVTVFLPDCFWITTLTALRPSSSSLSLSRVHNRLMPRGSSKESSTRPMSSMRIGWPLRLPMISRPKESALSTRPSTRRIFSDCRRSTRPPGSSRFSRISAWRTSSIVRFSYLASLSGSTITCTARGRPPTSTTEPTPEVVSSSSLKRLRAISVISRMSRLPEITSVITGVALRESLSMIGGSVPTGSWLRMVRTLASTSWAAKSPFFSSLNCTTT